MVVSVIGFTIIGSFNVAAPIVVWVGRKDCAVVRQIMHDASSSSIADVGRRIYVIAACGRENGNDAISGREQQPQARLSGLTE